LIARGAIRFLVPASALLIAAAPGSVQALVPPALSQWGGFALFVWMILMAVAVLMPGGRGWYDHLLRTRVFRREAETASLTTKAFEVQLHPAIPVAHPAGE
jgi:hypothetical protein